MNILIKDKKIEYIKSSGEIHDLLNYKMVQDKAVTKDWWTFGNE